MSDRIYYFDNNATTGVAPEVLDAMLPFLQEEYGNPSSMYRFAAKSEEAVKLAREQVAHLIGASPEEIIFTSCGTESDSTAVYAALNALPTKKHFITTKVEHSALIALGQYLETKGYRVTFLEVDSKGNLDLDAYEKALTPDTALVSVMMANNETGVIFPIQKMAEMAKKKGILFHTDAVQAIGKIPVDVATLPVDYLSLSGHKLHAPKGVGALYVRKGSPYRPFLRGGHQESGKRAGTESVHSIVAFGKACELSGAFIEEENTVVRNLRDSLESQIMGSIPEAIINGDTESRLPNTTNISFKYVEGEAILLMLDLYGICASSGSACTSGSLEPSHVLRAMDVPFTYAHGSLRLSLSRYNTQEEVDFIAKTLPGIIKRLREISPYKKLDDEAKAGSCKTCSASCGANG